MDKNQIEISLGSIEKALGHVHDGFICLLVVNGSIDVEVDGKPSSLDTDDIIVINSNQFHSVQGNIGNVVLKLKVGKQYLEKECHEFLEYDIKCDSSKLEASEERKYFEIKRMFTQMLIVYLNKKDGYNLEFKSIFFKFIHILFQYFRVEKSYDTKIKYKENTNSISDIITYINENYKENLSLNVVANKAYMSPQYFSKFFKRKIGIGFLQYLTQIRLEHSVADLTYTDNSILKIAMKNGFANGRSFTAAFKKKYDETPSEYRKNHKRIIAEEYEENNNKFNVEISNGLLEFLKYIKRNDTIEEEKNVKVVTERINLDNSLNKQFHKPVKIINIDNIRSALKAET